ncbi:MAG: tetratricopeptide repeat protein [Phycisphaerae bacterium]
MRHGCRLLMGALALAVPAGPVGAAETMRVRSRLFDLEYRVNAAAQPLDTVRLWYTLDRGKTWQLYGLDDDRQPPLRFNASQEGLYGFYLVVTNAAGSSGPEPVAGTAPQRLVWVDYTPPIVQLHRPVAGENAGLAEVALRWTAIDAQLPPRPVSLSVRVAPDGPWRTIAERLANTGRYDWRVPEDVRGKLILRITVVDQGGNRVEAATTFEVSPLMDAATDEQPAQSADADATLTAAETPLDGRVLARSGELYRAALRHRDRGENKLAMARLRDALKLNPKHALALVDLASLLYAEGDHSAASEAYELALQQRPNLRSGLEGMARTRIALRQYGAAAQALRKITKDHPEDAQTWLNLGDVAIYQGDELAAQAHYKKAMTLDPQATEVIARARMRLADLSALREKAVRHHNRP